MGGGYFGNGLGCGLLRFATAIPNVVVNHVSTVIGHGNKKFRYVHLIFRSFQRYLEFSNAVSTVHTRNSSNSKASNNSLISCTCGLVHGYNH